MPGAVDDTQEVSSPYSALNRNGLTNNSVPTGYGSGGGFGGGYVAPASSGGSVNRSFTNGLAAGASPIALMSGGGSGSGSGSPIVASGGVDALAGGIAPGSGSPTLTAAQQTKLGQVAADIGASPTDLYAVINYETNRTFDPGIMGGKGGEHLGLLQFGPNEQKKYGVNKDQSFDEQLDAAGQYLKDRGFKPGMGLPHLYSIVNAGSLKPNGQPRWNARDSNASIKQHIAQIEKHFYPTSPETIAADATPDVLAAPPSPLVRPYKQGDSDPAIQPFQQALKDRGYYTDVIDGKFGPKTKAAVNAARENAGMSLNGLLDDELQRRLAGGTPPAEVPMSAFTRGDFRNALATGVDPALVNPRLTDAMGGGRATPAEMTTAIEPYTQAALDARQAVTKPHVAVETRPGTGPGRSPTGNQLVKTAAQGSVELPTKWEEPFENIVERSDRIRQPYTAAHDAVAAGEPGTLEEIRQWLGVTEPPAAPITGRAEAGANVGSQASLAGPPGATLRATIDPEAVEPAAVRPTAPEIDFDQPPPATVPASDRIRPATPAGAARDRAMSNQVQFDNMYRALKPGDLYVDPHGNTRRKGGSGKAYDKSSDAGGNMRVASADNPYGLPGNVDKHGLPLQAKPSATKWSTKADKYGNFSDPKYMSEDQFKTWMKGYVDPATADQMWQDKLDYERAHDYDISPDGETPTSQNGRVDKRQVATRDSRAWEDSPGYRKAMATDDTRYLLEGKHFVPSYDANDDMLTFSDPAAEQRRQERWGLPARYYAPGYRPVDQGNRDNALNPAKYYRTL